MTWQNTRTLPRGGARKTALKVDNGWIQTANESGKRFDTFTTLLVCFLPSFIRSFVHSLARTKDTLTIAIAFLKAAPVTIKPLKRFKVYSRSKSNALLCSLARSIGRLVSFHFLSLRAHSTARHGTARTTCKYKRTGL